MNTKNYFSFSYKSKAFNLLVVTFFFLNNLLFIKVYKTNIQCDYKIIRIVHNIYVHFMFAT